MAYHGGIHPADVAEEVLDLSLVVTAPPVTGKKAPTYITLADIVKRAAAMVAGGMTLKGVAADLGYVAVPGWMLGEPFTEYAIACTRLRSVLTTSQKYNVMELANTVTAMGLKQIIEHMFLAQMGVGEPIAIEKLLDAMPKYIRLQLEQTGEIQQSGTTINYIQQNIGNLDPQRAIEVLEKLDRQRAFSVQEARNTLVGIKKAEPGPEPKACQHRGYRGSLGMCSISTNSCRPGKYPGNVDCENEENKEWAIGENNVRGLRQLPADRVSKRKPYSDLPVVEGELAIPGMIADDDDECNAPAGVTSYEVRGTPEPVLGSSGYVPPPTEPVIDSD